VFDNFLSVISEDKECQFVSNIPSETDKAFSNLLTLLRAWLLVCFSITAELLAGARALSLADRHHFNLNLSDFLDKSTQHKRNWLLNVIAARQRFERQQANFEGIQTISIANSKLIKWMTGQAS